MSECLKVTLLIKEYEEKVSGSQSRVQDSPQKNYLWGKKTQRNLKLIEPSSLQYAVYFS